MVVYDAYYAYGIFVTLSMHIMLTYVQAWIWQRKNSLFLEYNMGVYTWIWQQENVLQNPDAVEFELTMALSDHIMVQLDLESAFSSFM